MFYKSLNIWVKRWKFCTFKVFYKVSFAQGFGIVQNYSYLFYSVCVCVCVCVCLCVFVCVRVGVCVHTCVSLLNISTPLSGLFLGIVCTAAWWNSALVTLWRYPPRNAFPRVALSISTTTSWYESMSSSERLVIKACLSSWWASQL